jgi:hypothetical protein
MKFQSLYLLLLLVISTANVAEGDPKSSKAARSGKGSKKCKKGKGKGDDTCVESGCKTDVVNGESGDFPDPDEEVTGPNDACCSGSSVGGICCVLCTEAMGPVLDRTGEVYADDTCCTGLAIFHTGSDEAYCTGFCSRRLHSEEFYERNPSKERSLQIIESMRGNPDASFVIKHELLSNKTCKDLADYTEYSLENDENPVFPFGHKNVYKKYITVPELVEMIGKESAHRLIDFFEEHRGKEEPITEVYLTRRSPSIDDEMYYTDWHIDCYSAMEVQLGSFDEPQEWLVHLTGQGPERYMGLPGTGMVHGQDIVHGTPPFFGDSPKYLLVLKHHPEEILNHHPKDVCLNNEIVNDLVQEL